MGVKLNAIRRATLFKQVPFQRKKSEVRAEHSISEHEESY